MRKWERSGYNFQRRKTQSGQDRRGGGVAERVGVGSAPASPCGLQMLAGLSSANSNLKIYLFRGIKISALFRMSLFAKKNISCQSYEGFTIINYDSRVVPDLKISLIMTLEP